MCMQISEKERRKDKKRESGQWMGTNGQTLLAVAGVWQHPNVWPVAMNADTFKVLFLFYVKVAGMEQMPLFGETSLWKELLLSYPLDMVLCRWN